MNISLREIFNSTQMTPDDDDAAFMCTHNFCCRLEDRKEKNIQQFEH